MTSLIVSCTFYGIILFRPSVVQFFLPVSLGLTVLSHGTDTVLHIVFRVEDLLSDPQGHLSLRCGDQLSLLLPFTFSSFRTQVPLMPAVNEQIDVFSQSTPRDYYEPGYTADDLEASGLLRNRLSYFRHRQGSD